MLENVVPLNKSWTLGFIHSCFPDITIKDFYLDNFNTAVNNNSKTAIVYLDDEVLGKADEVLQFLDKDNDIIICKKHSVYIRFQQLGFIAVLLPFFHIYDDCMALVKLNMYMPVNSNSDVAFFCLNRNLTEHRLYLLSLLDKMNLTKSGYVTCNNANNIPNITQLPNVKYDNCLTHYVSSDVGFERNNHVTNGVELSSNVLNCFYIANNIPGIVNIAVETKMFDFFPSEKSFLFLFTKRVPIILAEPGRIAVLREQGFDVFDDFVDHSYDDELDPYKRIDKAITTNERILTYPLLLDTKRVNNNYEFVLNDWFPNELHTLKNELGCAINKLTDNVIKGE